MYKVLDLIIYSKYIIYVVPGSILKNFFLKSAHDSPLAGHPGFFKTYRMLRERFYWKGLKSDVIKYVYFPTWKQNKVEHNHIAGLLHPFPIPKQKWESISMDFIIGLPKVLGKDFIFFVVDRLTKFDHLFSITTSFTISQVAELFFREFFILHELLLHIFLVITILWQPNIKTCLKSTSYEV